jgi:hypothetical protein
MNDTMQRAKIAIRRPHRSAIQPPDMQPCSCVLAQCVPLERDVAGSSSAQMTYKCLAEERRGGHDGGHPSRKGPAPGTFVVFAEPLIEASHGLDTSKSTDIIPEVESTHSHVSGMSD